MLDSSYERLRAYVDDQIRQRAEHENQRHNYEQAALQQAFAANDERLHSMNEFRSALNDSMLRNITREEAESRINALDQKLDEKVEILDEKAESIRRPNWTLISVIGSLLGGGLAVLWLFIGLQINNSETPLSLAISQLREQAAAVVKGSTDQSDRTRILEERAQRSSLADEQSRVDRAQLNTRVADLERLVAANESTHRAEVATINAKLLEVETQFCGADIMRNLQHTGDLRILSILWHRTAPAEVFPTDVSYMPKICHGGGTAKE